MTAYARSPVVAHQVHKTATETPRQGAERVAGRKAAVTLAVSGGNTRHSYGAAWCFRRSSRARCRPA